MESIIFKPKYSFLTWALLFMYAAPWLFGIPNALFGHSNSDWKLFWLLSGTVWLIAGLLHLKIALLKSIIIADVITIEMMLQKPVSLARSSTIHIWGDVAQFKFQDIHMQYLGNASELMQLFVALSDKGDINMIYEEHGKINTAWTTEKNLYCLITFALYMMAMLGLHLRPIHLVGTVTDTFLLGWALMLPVLLAIKAMHLVRERMRWGESSSKWL